MRCPKCGGNDDEVVDSRESSSGESVRRRRMCQMCGHRFTTYEKISRPVLMVEKRDGREEPFDEGKLRRSVQNAVVKRSLDPARIDLLVNETTAKIRERYQELVPSMVIGEEVMGRLEGLDEVAYLRYASIFRRFRDAAQFISAIDNLINR
ncbi:MAG: transcriptional repressor NrdR [Kiritimatiellae bacterium]|jgi:transcriptional repressor NrdR|nr:transcriptional repressor NrdR [Kiritimatiellia bacterium]